MLLSLDIKNVALITHLKIEFGRGLNILSGETGAGKSIILDSLSFALGSKGDKSLIRSGESSMSVEAVFDISGDAETMKYLEGIGFEDELVIIYRTLGNDSRGTIQLNGRTITLSMLREIAGRIIDIYSQAEHISLLKPSTHLKFLDGYGGIGDLHQTAELRKAYEQYRETVRQLKESSPSEDRDRLTELYRFQIEEIERAALSEEEEEELIRAQGRLNNVERLSDELKQAMGLLKGYGGIGSLLSAANAIVYKCSRYDSGLAPVAERLESAAIEIEDIEVTINDYLYNLEYDPREAERVEKRLDLIKNLKRKYGRTIGEINEYLEKIRAELDRLENSRQYIEELERKKAQLEDELYELSVFVSQKRKESAEKFKSEVLENLSDLSMKGCSFEVCFDEFPSREEVARMITSSGMDRAEFFIATNKGEPLKPLAKIISGGEMSRFMLAIKSIISDIDDIDTLIFDEIDTGISGDTATAVAKKFAAISLRHQIIAITHLPQIAAMADVNFLIEKREAGSATQTFITRLSGEGKAQEVARLIGAKDLSSHAVLHAKEMIAWSESYKEGLKAKKDGD